MSLSPSLEALITSRVDALPLGLREHVHRVAAIAQDLAGRHQLDKEKVRWGALAHDLARATKGDELLRQARDLGIAIHPVEEQVPLLLHGPVAAEMLKRNGLEDQAVYDSVYWHSTAHTHLVPEAKVVFLADKLDPQKLQRYPYLGELGWIAVESLDRAVLTFLDRELTTLIGQGSLVHPASVDARNQLLMEDVRAGEA